MDSGTNGASATIPVMMAGGYLGAGDSSECAVTIWSAGAQAYDSPHPCTACDGLEGISADIVDCITACIAEWRKLHSRACSERGSL